MTALGQRVWEGQAPCPDFFVRRADCIDVLVGIRPDDRISDADSAVFTATVVWPGGLAQEFAEPGPLRARAAEVGDPLAVLPVHPADRRRIDTRLGVEPVVFGGDQRGRHPRRERRAGIAGVMGAIQRLRH